MGGCGETATKGLRGLVSQFSMVSGVKDELTAGKTNGKGNEGGEFSHH